MANLTAVPVGGVAEIQRMNKKGRKPPRLNENPFSMNVDPGFQNTAGQESITRFDDKNKKGNHRRNRNKRKRKKNDRRKRE